MQSSSYPASTQYAPSQEVLNKRNELKRNSDCSFEEVKAAYTLPSHKGYGPTGPTGSLYPTLDHERLANDFHDSVTTSRFQGQAAATLLDGITSDPASQAERAFDLKSAIDRWDSEPDARPAWKDRYLLHSDDDMAAKTLVEQLEIENRRPENPEGVDDCMRCGPQELQ